MSVANPLLSHRWGESRGADRVWAQVVGYAPSTKPWERLLVVLTEFQAYMDESYDDDEYVVAGYVAPASKWAQFSADWERLLPLLAVDKHGNRRFKMREVVRDTPTVRAFYEVIQKHVSLAVYCRINLQSLARAKASLWSPPELHIDWNIVSHPYKFVVRAMLDMFHANRITNVDREKIEKIIPAEERVDFYFDSHSSQRAIQEGWDAYMSNRPDWTKNLYGAVPRFDKEENLLPIQAADFWAWWVRNAYKQNGIDELHKGHFRSRWGEWDGTPITGLAIEFNEDQIAEDLRGMIRPFLEPWRHIYRVRYWLNGERL